MHPNTQILDHARSVRLYADAARLLPQGSEAWERHIDLALHQMTLAMKLYYSQRRFDAMVDDLQGSLRGSNVVNIKSRQGT